MAAEVAGFTPAERGVLALMRASTPDRAGFDILHGLSNLRKRSKLPARD